jgi:Subtilase family
MSLRRLLLTLLVLCAPLAVGQGRGQVVAIIADGVDETAPGLAGTVRGGWDFVDDDDDPGDGGVGTIAAQIILGDGAQLPGIAPEATLLAYRVRDWFGNAKPEHVIAALRLAVADGADVIYVGVGFRGSPDDAVSRAADEAVAAGVVVCAAAGEVSDPAGQVASVQSPAAARRVIAAGAAYLDYDGVFRVSPFTAFGPATEAMTFKPDVVADAMVKNGVHSAPTAKAAAHVAGMVAVLRERHPGWTSADIRSALITTAGKVDDYWNNVLSRGGGFADLERAGNASVFATDPAVMFGLHAQTSGTSVTTRLVTLRNRGRAAQRLSATATTSDPAASLSVVPSFFTIPPAGSVNVRLELRTDYAMLPFPEHFVIGGDVEFTGTTDLHVPWAMMRGARVTVHAPPTWKGTALAFGESGERALRPWMPGRGELWVAPGNWDFLLLAPAADGTPVVLTAEDQRIDGASSIAIGFGQTLHRIELRGVDERGERLSRRTDYLAYLSIAYKNGDGPRSTAKLWLIEREPVVLFAQSSPRFTAVAEEWAFEPATKRATSLVHEVLHGVTQSRVLVNDPALYRHVTLRLPRRMSVCHSSIFKGDPSPWAYSCSSTDVDGDLEYYATEEGEEIAHGVILSWKRKHPMLRAIDGAFVFGGWDAVPSPGATRYPYESTIAVRD